jgi:hypothetical protein
MLRRSRQVKERKDKMNKEYAGMILSTINPPFNSPATNKISPEKNDKNVAYKIYRSLPGGARGERVLQILKIIYL